MYIKESGLEENRIVFLDNVFVYILVYVYHVNKIIGSWRYRYIIQTGSKLGEKQRLVEYSYF